MTGNAPVFIYKPGLFGDVAGKQVTGFNEFGIEVPGQFIAFERSIFFKSHDKGKPCRISIFCCLGQYKIIRIF